MIVDTFGAEASPDEAVTELMSTVAAECGACTAVAAARVAATAHAPQTLLEAAALASVAQILRGGPTAPLGHIRFAQLSTLARDLASASMAHGGAQRIWKSSSPAGRTDAVIDLAGLVMHTSTASPAAASALPPPREATARMAPTIVNDGVHHYPALVLTSADDADLVREQPSDRDDHDARVLVDRRIDPSWTVRVDVATSLVLRGVRGSGGRRARTA